MSEDILMIKEKINEKITIDDNSGVYIIYNKINEKLYVGSTDNFRKRRNAHFSSLKKNTHYNKHLQNAFNLHGKENFIFCILEYINVDDLENRENYWLFKLSKTIELYNIFPTAYSVRGENHPMFGLKHSQESREKIKLARSKQIIKHSEETRKKIARFGRIVSPEIRKKISDAKKGKKLSKEHREKSINILKEIHRREREKLESKINPLIEEYRNGSSMLTLSKKFNINQTTVKNLLKEKNIKIRNIFEQNNIFLKDLSKIKKEETNKKVDIKSIIEEYKNDKSLGYLSKKYGISPPTIRRILTDNNIYIRSNSEQQLGKKINVSEIIGKYKKNENLRNLGIFYSVSPAVIKRILIKNGILIRNSFEQKRLQRNKIDDIEIFVSEYINGDSLSKLVRKYKMTFNSVKKLLKEKNIKIRTISEQKIIDDKRKE